MRWKRDGRTCEKAADELVGIERHELVSLGAVDPIILPLESNALVIESDEATVGDGDAVSVAREVAQHFLRAPKWSFAVDDPLGVAQRCQISGEASGIGERNVLTKELELSDLIGTGKLLQESQLLQYAVAERVRALGWERVEIINSDLDRARVSPPLSGKASSASSAW
jgi:hypothetical protein